MSWIAAVLFAAHLICMNVASAGPLVCIWLETRAASGDRLAERLNLRLSQTSVGLLLLGGLIGLLGGLVVWNAEYGVAMGLLSRKMLWGGLEFLFSLVLLAIHIAWARRRPTVGWRERLGRCGLLFLAGTNLLYHFPFLFVILSNLAHQRIVVDEPISAAIFRGLMVRADVLPRVAHFVFASFAVTGAALIHLATYFRDETGELNDDARRAAIWGGRLGLLATLAQLPVGMWLVTAIPRTAQRAIMGQDTPATAAFALSLVLSLWLMHQLADVAQGRGDPKRWTRALMNMLVVIVAMTFVLQRIKAATNVSPSEQASAASPAEPSRRQTFPAVGDRASPVAPSFSNSLNKTK